MEYSPPNPEGESPSATGANRASQTFSFMYMLMGIHRDATGHNVNHMPTVCQAYVECMSTICHPVGAGKHEEAYGRHVGGMWDACGTHMGDLCPVASRVDAH